MLILLFLSPWTTLFVTRILPSNEHRFLSSTKRLFIQGQWKQPTFSMLWAFGYMLNDCVNSRPYQRIRLPFLCCTLNLTFLVTFIHIINLFMPFFFQFCYYLISIKSFAESCKSAFCWSKYSLLCVLIYFLLSSEKSCNVTFSPFKKKILASPLILWKSCRNMV